MKVWLAQLKCQNNHCIIAAARVARDEDDARELANEVNRKFARMVSIGALNPYCGLCQSKEFWVDYGPTAFQTLEEASGPLSESQEQQQATAEAVRKSLSSSKN